MNLTPRNPYFELLKKTVFKFKYFSLWDGAANGTLVVHVFVDELTLAADEHAARPVAIAVNRNQLVAENVEFFGRLANDVVETQVEFVVGQHLTRLFNVVELVLFEFAIVELETRKHRIFKADLQTHHVLNNCVWSFQLEVIFC